MSRSLQLLALVFGFTIVAAGAHAQEFNEGTGPDKKISAGLLLGYGIGFDEVNLWGFGLGVRGGYNLNQIYLGGRFTYNFGESYEDVLGLTETTMSMWELGIEGGYDFLVAEKLWVRPELGMGVATTSIDVDTDIGGGSNSNSNFYLAFGASLLYDITPVFFLGVDTRLMVIIGDGSAAAMVFLANAGMRF
jgi:Outer membrane protein beta-barrel domain